MSLPQFCRWNNCSLPWLTELLAHHYKARKLTELLFSSKSLLISGVGCLNSCLGLHVLSVVPSYHSYFLTCSCHTKHLKNCTRKLATLEPLDFCFWYFLYRLHQANICSLSKTQIASPPPAGRPPWFHWRKWDPIYSVPQANSVLHLEVSHTSLAQIMLPHWSVSSFCFTVWQNTSHPPLC